LGVIPGYNIEIYCPEAVGDHQGSQDALRYAFPTGC
jgi:hypothetical protein